MSFREVYLRNVLCSGTIDDRGRRIIKQSRQAIKPAKFTNGDATQTKTNKWIYHVYLGGRIRLMFVSKHGNLQDRFFEIIVARQIYLWWLPTIIKRQCLLKCKYVFSTEYSQQILVKSSEPCNMQILPFYSLISIQQVRGSNYIKLLFIEHSFIKRLRLWQFLHFKNYFYFSCCGFCLSYHTKKD